MFSARQPLPDPPALPQSLVTSDLLNVKLNLEPSRLADSNLPPYSPVNVDRWTRSLVVRRSRINVDDGLFGEGTGVWYGVWPSGQLSSDGFDVSLPYAWWGLSSDESIIKAKALALFLTARGCPIDVTCLLAATLQVSSRYECDWTRSDLTINELTSQPAPFPPIPAAQPNHLHDASDSTKMSSSDVADVNIAGTSSDCPNRPPTPNSPSRGFRDQMTSVTTFGLPSPTPEIDSPEKVRKQEEHAQFPSQYGPNVNDHISPSPRVRAMAVSLRFSYVLTNNPQGHLIIGLGTPRDNGRLQYEQGE
ncbi:hypothetical protein IAR55_007193 [Kwoniella newhampshirensis]|uniref:Uncharacterized protein n=1 Tax=Kwoniella newhampshirensis TaxID=1651941 RepID=A0AAW0YD33_9TREE